MANSADAGFDLDTDCLNDAFGFVAQQANVFDVNFRLHFQGVSL